jgi:HAMP domain-containing protein
MSHEFANYLRRLRQQIDAFEAQVARTNGKRWPRKELSELKELLDQARTLAWALLQAEEGKAGASGDGRSASELIAEFRLRRGTRLVNDIRNDIDAGDIDISNPDLRPYFEAVDASMRRMARIFKRGM